MTFAPARLSALALALVLSTATDPARAEGEDFDAALKRGVTELVQGLEQVATWCQKAKLFRSRNEVYERVLAFDPHHAQARKRLRYKRDASGAWVRPGRYKPPRNMKADGAEELAERLRAVGDRFADHAMGLLTRHGAALPPERRRRVARLVVTVAPHRTDAREANDEIQSADGRWLLGETVRAMTRAKEMREAAQRAIHGGAGPKKVRPNRTDNAARLGWKAILQGKRVRLLGTPPEEELVRTTRHTDASFAVFRAAFGVAPPACPGLTMYLLQSDAERRTLLANHPNRTKEHAKQALRRDSSWFPKTNMVFVLSATPPRRLEWCVRQANGMMLNRGFGVRARIGWAYEGFGLYLSHLVTGTRQTHFVQQTKYEDATNKRREEEMWTKLKRHETDWRAEARTMLAGTGAPDLALLLGKGTNTMDGREMLYSYVLAAYCVEGHGPKAVKLLRAFGKEKRPPAEAVARGLGMSIEDLAARVKRWLDETA